MSPFTPRYLLVPKGGMKRKMNTRSRKALSPVVASIILIAVTVAVSIAVAAWMGALTFTFTSTEQVSITNLTFQTGVNGNINITASNTGTNPVTVNEIWINNGKVTTGISPALAYTITGNNQTMFTVTYSVTAGYSYQVKLVSSKGNAFISTGTAPS